MSRKLPLSEVKGALSRGDRLRRMAEEQRAREHKPGIPQRPQGLTRQERNVWDATIRKLSPLKKLYTDNIDLILQLVRAQMATDKREMKRLVDLILAQETWPESSEETEPETEQETLKLSAFLFMVEHERDSFPERMQPDETICHVDGAAYTWPEGDYATVARRYACAVVEGHQIAGDLLKQSCARLLADLEDGCVRGLWFDPIAANNVCLFAEVFCKLKLMAWQQFVLANIFGWKRASGTRRFTEVFLSVARKNGKTTLASTIALFVLVTAHERTPAEVYSAAVKKDQSRICWKDGKRAVMDSPELQTVIHPWAHELTTIGGASFTALASEEKSLDGLRVSCAILDELHAWVSREVFDRLVKGTASRTEPLIIEITTAGESRGSFCWSKQELGERILRGVFRDDTTFVCVFAIDPGDDYKDETCWVKANPSLDNRDVMKIEHLQKSVREVEEDPSGLNAFLRFHCNTWPEINLSRHGSITHDKWEACSGFDLIGTDNPKEAINKFLSLNQDTPCYGGWDLGGSSDMTAFILLWPKARFSEGGELIEKKEIACQHYMPEMGLLEKERKWHVPLSIWAREGWVTLTPGDLTDPVRIKDEIIKDCRSFNVRELGYDPWRSQFMGAEINETGLTCAEVSQTHKTLTAVCREFLGAVARREIVHFGNPCLAWNAVNVVMEENPSHGGIKPEKRAPPDSKIDAISALLNAWHRMLSAPPPITRGIVLLDLNLPFTAGGK